MNLHLIHCLVITHYESTTAISNLDWEEVSAQDFATHGLYCQETNSFFVYSDSLKYNPEYEISQILNVLTMLNIQFEIANKIIVVENNEERENQETVLKYFQ